MSDKSIILDRPICNGTPDGPRLRIVREYKPNTCDPSRGDRYPYLTVELSTTTDAMGQRTWVKCDHKMAACDLGLAVSVLADTVSEKVP